MKEGGTARRRARFASHRSNRHTSINRDLPVKPWKPNPSEPAAASFAPCSLREIDEGDAQQSRQRYGPRSGYQKHAGSQRGAFSAVEVLGREHGHEQEGGRREGVSDHVERDRGAHDGLMLAGDARSSATSSGDTIFRSLSCTQNCRCQ